MKTEVEARILDINVSELIERLEKVGAKFVNNYNQKRYIYDFKPVQKGKWIRLRTDGEKTTLTIKEIKNDSIQGTEELEIEVSDIESTNLILEGLGYKARNYQENKRTRYIYNDIEIDIDTWPKIPTYVEFEGVDEKELFNFVNMLGFTKDDLITYGVSKIYKHYELDIDDYDILKFD